ncbi:MAG: hypothetical protein K8823_632 [Cenarchaeum symbiont of Oopsacas minuta]|nr:hypothetical protein [Cenarchaeum symbiont of Oopsacas minuta]
MLRSETQNNINLMYKCQSLKKIPYIINTYKGIMYSTNIQFFSDTLQDGLQTLYHNMDIDRRPYILEHIGDIHYKLDKMVDDNTHSFKQKVLLSFLWKNLKNRC